MKFDIKLGEFSPENPVRVGNVYPVKGGYGTRAKHMMVILAFTKDETALLFVLNKDGDPVGITQYAASSMADRMPIGFVHGINEMSFDVVPI
jgi:hypothetical protein